MMQRFDCGHSIICEMWKDDFWFKTKGLCPECKRRRRPLNTRLIIKGDKRLIIILKRR